MHDAWERHFHFISGCSSNQNCDRFVVHIDSTIDSLPANPNGSSPRQQVEAAITEYYSSIFSGTLRPNLVFDTDVGAPGNIIIQAGSLPDTPNAGASQPAHNGTISYQTITINTTGVLPNSTQPIFDPTQPGYSTYFYKVILHELGHTFGLADVYLPGPCNQHQAASVMSQVCGVNDSGQGISAGLTQCDIDAIDVIYPMYDDGGNPGCGYYDQVDYFDVWAGTCFQHWSQIVHYYCGSVISTDSPILLSQDCSG